MIILLFRAWVISRSPRLLGTVMENRAPAGRATDTNRARVVSGVRAQQHQSRRIHLPGGRERLGDQAGCAAGPNLRTRRAAARRTRRPWCARTRRPCLAFP